MVKNPSAMWDTWVWCLGQGDPLEEGMGTHSHSFLKNPYGQKSLAAYSPCGLKESDMTERLSTHTHTQMNQLPTQVNKFTLQNKWFQLGTSSSMNWFPFRYSNNISCLKEGIPIKLDNPIKEKPKLREEYVPSVHTRMIYPTKIKPVNI